MNKYKEQVKHAVYQVIIGTIFDRFMRDEIMERIEHLDVWKEHPPCFRKDICPEEP